MPIVYVCKNCGYVLFRFEKVGQDFFGARSHRDIAKMYNGKCPKCGHEIQAPEPEDIIIRPKRIARPVVKQDRSGGTE